MHNAKPRYTARPTVLSPLPSFSAMIFLGPIQGFFYSSFSLSLVSSPLLVSPISDKMESWGLGTARPRRGEKGAKAGRGEIKENRVWGTRTLAIMAIQRNSVFSCALVILLCCFLVYWHDTINLDRSVALALIKHVRHMRVYRSYHEGMRVMHYHSIAE